MKRITRRQALAALSGAGVAGLAGCVGGTGGGGDDGGDATTTGDDGSSNGGSDDGGGNAAAGWRAAELTDVRSGETFTVESLGKPVLLETFAVWCSTCLRQQKELRAFHEDVGDSVTSVTLNIDPNEDADKVREHLDRHGFDWRYAVAPAEVTNSLVDEFGSTVTVPPRAPVIVVCPDSARLLPNGVKSVADLQEAVESC